MELRPADWRRRCREGLIRPPATVAADATRITRAFPTCGTGIGLVVVWIVGSLWMWSAGKVSTTNMGMLTSFTAVGGLLLVPMTRLAVWVDDVGLTYRRTFDTQHIRWNRLTYLQPRRSRHGDSRYRVEIHRRAPNAKFVIFEGWASVQELESQMRMIQDRSPDTIEVLPMGAIRLPE